MIVNDAESAREYIAAWGRNALNPGRFARTAASMRACAGLCRPGNDAMRDDYLAAARVLDEAAADYGSNKKA